MKVTNSKIFGLILVGGHSRRMGQDKAFLEFKGKPQIERAFDLLGGYCAQVFVSKRPDQPLPNLYPIVNDLDIFAHHGPLGGILSAMNSYPDVTWLVMACDLPLVVEATLETLLASRDPQKIATAFISTQDALPEPLCAIWEGHGYASIVKLFDEGIHCPRKVLIKSSTHLIMQTNPDWLDNINLPQEYAQIKKSSF